MRWRILTGDCAMRGNDTMTRSVTLMSLPFGLLFVLLASLQYRSMSPRMYNFLEATAVLIGTTAMYEGMPANAFDWSNRSGAN
jgi:hypothetical protein